MNQRNWLVSFLLFGLLLTAVFGCSSDQAFKAGVAYTCNGGKSFVVEAYEEVDIAFLKVGEETFYLPGVASESGKKYSDGCTTLWLKGQDASVEPEGRSQFKNCTRNPK
jgi:membrane-bound inhibitor of C-type lysozyme